MTTEPDDAVRVLEAFMPKNVCLDNTNVPDSEPVPLTTTIGELRRVRQAIRGLGVQHGNGYMIDGTYIPLGLPGGRSSRAEGENRITGPTLVEFPKIGLTDIPTGLRNLAQVIEESPPVVGMDGVTHLTWISLDQHGRFSVGALGRDMDSRWKVAGMTQQAIAEFLSGEGVSDGQ